MRHRFTDISDGLAVCSIKSVRTLASREIQSRRAIAALTDVLHRRRSSSRRAPAAVWLQGARGSRFLVLAVSRRPRRRRRSRRTRPRRPRRGRLVVRVDVVAVERVVRVDFAVANRVFLGVGFVGLLGLERVLLGVRKVVDVGRRRVGRRRVGRRRVGRRRGGRRVGRRFIGRRGRLLGSSGVLVLRGCSPVLGLLVWIGLGA